MERVANWYEILELQLRNIRGFRELNLDLQGTDGRAKRLTLIIGKNGTCKSSLLRAIAVGLAFPTEQGRMISEPVGRLVSRESESASIAIKLTGTNRAQVRTDLGRSGDREILFKSTHEGSENIKWPQAFVCGYGAGRFGPGPLEESGSSYRISDAVLTLFRYSQPLMVPELTLRRLESTFKSRAYCRILQNIQRALGLTLEDRIEVRPTGGVVVSGPTVGESVTLEGWADGYRLTFNWILDLYSWAVQAGSIDEDGNIEGILLIDEIEQHLHPSMQAEILPRLSELLPKMQIFATTHSPLVALDAKPEELVVLRREGDQVVAQQTIPDFTGYSAEDMLSDPRLFDSPVYGEETREKLSEYNELVAIPRDQRSPEQVRRLRSLANEVSSFSRPEAFETESTRMLKQLIEKHGL